MKYGELRSGMKLSYMSVEGVYTFDITKVNKRNEYASYSETLVVYDGYLRGSYQGHGSVIFHSDDEITGYMVGEPNVWFTCFRQGDT